VQLGGWTGSPAATARLRAIGEAFVPLRADHDCVRLRFELTASPRRVQESPAS
jgi:hypothetical protein